MSATQSFVQLKFNGHSEIFVMCEQCDVIETVIDRR